MQFTCTCVRMERSYNYNTEGIKRPYSYLQQPRTIDLFYLAQMSAFASKKFISLPESVGLNKTSSDDTRIPCSGNGAENSTIICVDKSQIAHFNEMKNDRKGPDIKNCAETDEDESVGPNEDEPPLGSFAGAIKKSDNRFISHSNRGIFSWLKEEKQYEEIIETAYPFDKRHMQIRRPLFCFQPTLSILKRPKFRLAKSCEPNEGRIHIAFEQEQPILDTEDEITDLYDDNSSIWNDISVADMQEWLPTTKKLRTGSSNKEADSSAISYEDLDDFVMMFDFVASFENLDDSFSPESFDDNVFRASIQKEVRVSPTPDSIECEIVSESECNEDVVKASEVIVTPSPAAASSFFDDDCLQQKTNESKLEIIIPDCDSVELEIYKATPVGSEDEEDEDVVKASEAIVPVTPSTVNTSSFFDDDVLHKTTNDSGLEIILPECDSVELEIYTSASFESSSFDFSQSELTKVDPDVIPLSRSSSVQSSSQGSVFIKDIDGLLSLSSFPSSSSWDKGSDEESSLSHKSSNASPSCFDEKLPVFITAVSDEGKDFVHPVAKSNIGDASTQDDV